MQSRVASVEQEAAFDFFGVLRVALVAVLDERWANLRFEKLDPGSIGLGSEPGGAAPEATRATVTIQ